MLSIHIHCAVRGGFLCGYLKENTSSVVMCNDK